MNGTDAPDAPRVPTLTAATPPTESRRPAAPRPQPARSLPTTSGTSDIPAAEPDLGTALLLRVAAPVVVAIGAAFVAAFVAWRLVHRRQR